MTFIPFVTGLIIGIFVGMCIMDIFIETRKKPEDDTGSKKEGR